MNDFVVFPATIIVDCAEQRPFGMAQLDPDFDSDIDPAELVPYTFGGLRADSRQKNKPLLVPRRVASLTWGDYSLEGYEDVVAVERKGFTDIFGTFGGRREQFETEIAHLNEYEAALVVFEANWTRILRQPPIQTKMAPKTILRTVIAWMQRYPRVAWMPCDDRDMAEMLTFRFLERFWRDKQFPPEKVKIEPARK